MGAHSGRWGVVDGHSTVRNWNIQDIQEPNTYYASNTQSGAGRKKGVRDWTGSFQQYGGLPTVLPGDTFTFKGFTAPDDDAETPGTGETYQGSAIVDQVAITWDWSTQAILQSAINFSGNGELTSSVAAALSDNTTPDTKTVCERIVEWASVSTFVEWENLTQAVLTLTCANQAYVNSSSVINGQCWRLRKKGNLDWTLALTEQETNRASLPNPGDDVQIRLYTTATNYWLLKWAHMGNFSNITVDRESGAIIGRTANFSMNGFDESLGTGVIDKPGGAQYWPFA